MARKPKTLTEVPQVSIIEACLNPQLLNLDLTDGQQANLRAILGMPLSDIEKALFLGGTRRDSYDPPPGGYLEVYDIFGRQSGKSTHIAAPLACYLACFVKRNIKETERASVLVVAPTMKQAKQTFSVICRMIERSPVLKGLIDGKPRMGADECELSLTNGVDIRILAANSQTLRGGVVIAAILEEAAHFKRTDSEVRNLDEVIDAILPAMSTVPDARLICITTPWAQLGKIWDVFSTRAEHPQLLVWQAPTWVMNPANPSVNSEAKREKMRRRDPQWFDREYGAQFSLTVDALLPPELVDRAVVRGVREFPTQSEIRAVAGLDPSSKGSDSFGFGLAHKTKEGKIFLDVSMAWKPPGGGVFLDYNAVLPTIVEKMNAYGAVNVFSDMVCAASLAAEFAKTGHRFQQVTTFGTRAADLYRSARQLFIANKVVLPDDPELISQLKQLTTVLADGGRSVVQARSGHDDRAIAACLAIYEASLIPEPRDPICTSVWENDPPQQVDLNKIPLGPGDEFYPPSHRFGPARWWR